MARLSRFPAAAAIPLSLIVSTAPASAQSPVEPADTDRVQIKPILDLRARFETVDQGALDADSFTVRARAGAEATLGSFSVLVEAEGTAAPIDNYNAFPFPLSSRQRRPQYAVIADPENAELNRLQLKYEFSKGAVTLGRQRINLDDQRWVGSVGWRQNEQTFDALRAESRLGPVGIDFAYALSQRSIFGHDGGPRAGYDGEFLFAGAFAKLGQIEGKLFAYLLDYDEPFFVANSSQTYGGIVKGSVPFGMGRNVSLRVSYARQFNYADNPLDYSADYWSFEGSTRIAGFAVAAGWERLGSDNGWAVQTPMATLHKFNGWTDLFLTTPTAGLDDAYVSVSRNLEAVSRLPGLNAALTFHQFDSARGNLEYGTEWDASLGVKLGRAGILLKYATYIAKGFGADTRKLWLQAEWPF